MHTKLGTAIGNKVFFGSDSAYNVCSSIVRAICSVLFFLCLLAKQIWKSSLGGIVVAAADHHHYQCLINKCHCWQCLCFEKEQTSLIACGGGGGGDDGNGDVLWNVQCEIETLLCCRQTDRRAPLIGIKCNHCCCCRQCWWCIWQIFDFEFLTGESVCAF